MRIDFDGPQQCIEPYSEGRIDFPGMSILADTGEEELCVENGAWIGWQESTIGEPPTYNLFQFDQPVSGFSLAIRATEHDEPISFGFGDGLVTMGAGLYSSGPLAEPITEIRWESGAIAYEVDWIEWSTVPEPSTALLVALGIFVLFARAPRTQLRTARGVLLRKGH